MRNLLPSLICSLFLAPQVAQACSCMGNESLCETLSPAWPSNPDAVALVVKLSDVHYGITVKVLQVFGGGTVNNDTVTVWGDTGVLCRHYLNGFAIGDTAVMALHITDQAGNGTSGGEFPPDLEQEDDYMLSICGVHWLAFVDGAVSGWITGPENQRMSLDEFEQVVTGCAIGTGVPEHAAEAFRVCYNNGSPIVDLVGAPGDARLRIMDAQGRVLLDRRWNGSPLPIAGGAPGAYLVEVRAYGQRSVKRVFVP